MEIHHEDVVSVVVTLLLLCIWFGTLMLFGYPLVSISMLWIGMITLSLIYAMVYRRKQRDMRVLKIRVLVSAVPIYPVLGYYVYRLLSGEGLPQELRFLPVIVVFTMLALNASVEYMFDRKSS